MSLIKITNERKFKVKIYAFFQFMSFASYLSVLLSIGLMGYFLMVHGGTINDTKAWWQEFGLIAKGVNHDALATSATVFLYIGISAIAVSYLIGFSITFAKKRNLYDSLFVLFIIIPGISNVFALMAQVSSREITFAKAQIDKKAIIQTEFRRLEETRITTIKQLQEKNKILEKMKIKNEKAEEKKEAKELAIREKQVIKENIMKAKMDEKAKMADGSKKKKTVKKVTPKKVTANTDKKKTK